MFAAPWCQSELLELLASTVTAVAAASYRGLQKQNRDHTEHEASFHLDFLRPFRKGGKTDANDAKAICTAVRQANLRFVTVSAIAAYVSGFACVLNFGDIAPGIRLTAVEIGKS